jgi:hypothetical protein
VGESLPKAKDFNAVEDRMPPVGEEVPFSVTGTVTVAAGSGGAGLHKRDVHGTALRLELDSGPGPGEGEEGQDIEVRYEEKVAPGTYTTVAMIMWGDFVVAADIPVEIVS